MLEEELHVKGKLILTKQTLGVKLLVVSTLLCELLFRHKCLVL